MWAVDINVTCWFHLVAICNMQELGIALALFEPKELHEGSL